MRGIVLTTLLATTSVNAGGLAGLVIHMSPADYSGCDLLVDDELVCEAIDAIGVETGPQHAWIIAYGWSGLDGWPAELGIGSAGFGVAYPPNAIVTDWTLCTGGSQIPVDDETYGTWPASGTGILVSWPEGGHETLYGFAKIGYLSVAEDSFGKLEIVPHPVLGRAELAAPPPADTTWEIPPAWFSTADIDGLVPDDGWKSCNGFPPPVVTSSWARVKALYR